MKRFVALLISPLLLFLVGCGYHLRGVSEIPQWLNNITIISNDGNKELISLLNTILEGYNIEVNPDPATAKYWLVISNVSVQQQIVSVGASTNPRQYQLILTVGYLLQTPKGDIIKPRRNVIINRQLTVNNDRILGSNEEEMILVSEMRRDAVIQILNRLSR
ncbi:LPS assembly lipoprotein LptE [Legionella waltersii]|uniref:LPS-assembly lipoprotein LptE n=1 Tax=Legionella waltersii TaxID=66969 RepID=A0A0W1ALW5_9GAMM|nr:LPS assembly lipoprotein LptE [Legionella waltersii]KTD82349.1 rare lipoprotein B [Legionella waltersii]SNV03901.1 Rare lipoprotein B [Legionella waltersii]